LSQAIGELRSVEAEDLEVVDDLEARRHDDGGRRALDDLDQTVLSRGTMNTTRVSWSPASWLLGIWMAALRDGGRRLWRSARLGWS